MTSKKLAKIAVSAVEELKGVSVVCLNVQKLTQITDFMIIVTGTSNTHIRAMSDRVLKQAKAADVTVVGIEGRMQGEWVLVDLGGAVVHLMLAPVRALYNLEELWNFETEAGNQVKL